MPRRRWKYKETDEQKCKRKLRHADFLSALLHARPLGVDRIDIYPCPICRGLHLGHTKLRYAAHCERQGGAKIAALLRRIRVQERLIADGIAIIQRLKQELEAAIITYDAGGKAE